jgi:hypothetical protein
MSQIGPQEGQTVHVATEDWNGEFVVTKVTRQGYTLVPAGPRRGPKPWVVTWTALRRGNAPRHASYKTKEAAERTVADLEQRPDLWGDVQRRYPDEASR